MKSEDIIRPCLQAKNASYTRWIASSYRCDLLEFNQARGKQSEGVVQEEGRESRGIALVGRKSGSASKTCSVGKEEGCQPEL